jgi:hypothetical protein
MRGVPLTRPTTPADAAAVAGVIVTLNGFLLYETFLG